MSLFLYPVHDLWGRVLKPQGLTSYPFGGVYQLGTLIGLANEVIVMSTQAPPG